MNSASAQLNNYRQSPRKVGLVANLVRGKQVARALAELEVLPKRASGPIAKLIRSAAANARGKGLAEESLVISRITVGKGLVMKRRAPKARGQSALIRKKASHVFLELSESSKKPEARNTKQELRKNSKTAPAREA